MLDLDKDFDKGCSFIERKKYDQAFEIFNSILKEDPEYYPALNKIGVIYANKNELDKARKYFEKALDINDRYTPALVNIGNIYKSEGNIISAEKYYLYSIECGEEYYLSYYNLAVLYKDKNQYDLYMKYLKNYKKLYKKYINNNIEKKSGTKKNIYTIGLIFIIVSIFSLLISFK